MATALSVKQTLSPYWQALSNVLFPPRCVACRVPVDAVQSFCGDCFEKIRLIDQPCCSLCGFPFEFDLGYEALCANCLHDVPTYDQARAALHYDAASRPLITRLKYTDQPEAVGAYSRQLYRVGSTMLQGCDVIIPVPLHLKRLRQRKYNQSALLAYGLSDLCKVPVLADGLVRVKHTPPQASLSRRERLTNVRTAFRVNHRHANRLNGASVMLIDDVMTTGATIDACSKILKGAGVAKVNVLTLARTIRD